MPIYTTFLNTLPAPYVSEILIQSLIFNEPLDYWCAQEYGVTTPLHYEALQYMLFSREEISLEAMCSWFRLGRGSGHVLNEMVEIYAPQYVGRVEFVTANDIATGAAEQDPETGKWRMKNYGKQG